MPKAVIPGGFCLLSGQTVTQDDFRDNNNTAECACY